MKFESCIDCKLKITSSKFSYSSVMPLYDKIGKLKQNIRCSHEVCKQTYSWGCQCIFVVDLCNTNK